MSEYYTRDGKPITLKQWAKRYETAEYSERRVAADVLPTGKYVSTVWLGLDLSFGEGPPLIFESMVFDCDKDGHVSSWSELDQDRYSTEVEALEGHKRLVDKWSKP